MFSVNGVIYNGKVHSHLDKLRQVVEGQFNARHLPLKRGFQPTQRMQRMKRNEMTSLLDRPITAASDDGVCRWHAVKLSQTHAIKYEIVEIKFDLYNKSHNK